MVRWYDYITAFLFADILLVVAFFPYIGFIAAYAVYELWMQVYCRWRYEQEYGE